jgi:hypothetical protein
MKRGMRVTFTTKGLMNATELSRRKVQKAREAFNQAVEQQLLDLVTKNFNDLSHGYAGVDGTKWKRLNADTVKKKGRTQIGVDTGELRDSVEVYTTNRGVSVKYNSPHAEYFDQERPLLPSAIPLAWKKKLESAGNKAMIRVLGQ